ncbi:Uncharacterised protein [Anaerobiospirillum thomasii]|uniref:Uncharacterized protein n=2 Tax=Anaerobiospirillum thomasii TaxID=179995 RepID=A0A2X0WWX7_9GAMM|nr:Uncharacterised protein [Anaerobiospirillum thomasii]
MSYLKQCNVKNLCNYLLGPIERFIFYFNNNKFITTFNGNWIGRIIVIATIWWVSSFTMTLILQHFPTALYTENYEPCTIEIFKEDELSCKDLVFDSNIYSTGFNIKALIFRWMSGYIAILKGLYLFFQQTYIGFAISSFFIISYLVTAKPNYLLISLLPMIIGNILYLIFVEMNV